jgi:thiol-disulfide isomerase/thioredoxin
MRSNFPQIIAIVATVSGSVASPSWCGEPNAQQASQPKPPAVALCLDSEGGAYSEGAVAQVKGQLLRCVVGPHWEPMDSSPEAARPAVLNTAGVNVIATQEAAILAALTGSSLPELTCDAVFNSNQTPTQLLYASAGKKVLVVFWTPLCTSCKPLLAELAAIAGGAATSTSVLGVVQAADPEFEPPGEWRLLRVKGLLTQYKVGFPTCVHSSTEVSERWQATGVPLTLLIADNRVQSVALGAANGHRLVAEVMRAK